MAACHEALGAHGCLVLRHVRTANVLAAPHAARRQAQRTLFLLVVGEVALPQFRAAAFRARHHAVCARLVVRCLESKRDAGATQSWAANVSMRALDVDVLVLVGLPNLFRGSAGESKCSQARATVCTHTSAPQPFLHVTRRWLHSSASWRWIREKGPSSPHSHLHFAGRCEQSSASWRVRWARNISSPQPALHRTHRRGHTLAWASCSSSGTLASQPAGRHGGQARARHRACQGGRTNRANRWPLRAAVRLVLGQLSEFARHTTPVLARPQPVRALVR